ncbi:MAG TPA: GNAT family protein [Anaerovoracaceae bacterium]|nr:GNAT family protein [Anaerovoracaceae bacterium]
METKRLLLRETELSDCKLFYKWEKDPDIVEYLAFEKDLEYEDVVKDLVIESSDPKKMLLTISLKEENVPIGRVIVSRINYHEDSLDITKIFIGETGKQNQGYGREAIEALLEYSFLELNMERVTLDYFVENKRAEALYRSMGFQYEGLMRNACKKDGKYYNLKLMSMLRNEYFSIYKKV